LPGRSRMRSSQQRPGWSGRARRVPSLGPGQSPAFSFIIGDLRQQEANESQEMEDTLSLGNPHPLRGSPPPKARLACINPTRLKGRVLREIRLQGQEMTLGRSDENTVVLDLDGISRTHARFIAGDGKWGVQDRGSKNGVRVNKTRVSDAWLQPGDIVSIGNLHYKYALEEHGPVETSAHQIDLRGTDATMLVKSIHALGTRLGRRSPASASPRRPASARSRNGVQRGSVKGSAWSEEKGSRGRATFWWSVGIAFAALAAFMLW